MGLFHKNSDAPAPYLTENQAPYPNDTYPGPAPSISRTRTDYSQATQGSKKNGYKGTKVPDTKYMKMLMFQAQTIEKRPYWNILAATFTWILLAGFIVLPGTYTKIEGSDFLQKAKEDDSKLENKILVAVTKLLVVAGVLCAIGILGILGLFLKWKGNYNWLINKLLLPALLNCLMGLLSTLVNVVGDPDKPFTETAIVSTSVTGGLLVALACAFLHHNFRLNEIKAKHIEDLKERGGLDPKDAIAEKYGEEAMV